MTISSDIQPSSDSWRTFAAEVGLLLLLMFIHGGDLAPGVNEAHYLIKAKNYWDPRWCANDLFASSGKAHAVFDFTFGALTQIASLEATAWIGRLVGWLLLAVGLQRLSWRLCPRPWASLLVALLWMVGTETANFAGEWVVGGIEAKVPAYGFLLLGLWQWLGPRPYLAWPLLGLASALHVIVGGWTVLALMLVSFPLMRRNWTKHLIGLCVGGALSLLGLIPAWAMSAGVPPEQSLAAARIYSFERLSHHLYAPSFPWIWYARFGFLIAITGCLLYRIRGDARYRRLTWFTMATLGIAGIGLLLGQMAHVAPDLSARLLRFYWFRLADAMVPLAGALAAAAVGFHWGHSVKLSSSPVLGSHLLRGLVFTLFAGALLWQTHDWIARMQRLAPAACHQSLLAIPPDATTAQQQATYRDWLAVCQWVKDNTPPETVFLTPRYQQTFKWYAERAEVVAWKDVPQDAKSLLEWSRRMRRVFPASLGGARVTIQYKNLRAFRQEYGAEYLISDQRIIRGRLPLVRVYPESDATNTTFWVYRLVSPIP